MKRTALALTLTVGLLFSTVAGMQTLKTARANFIPTVGIGINSPINGTTYESIPLLEVTVNFYAWGNRSKFVVYSVDDSANTTLTGNSLNIDEILWFTGSTALPKLSGGKHCLKVYAWVDIEENSGFTDRSSRVREVIFYMNNQETSEPTIVPPAISVCVPQNNSVTSANSIPLIFNVSAPEASDTIQSQLHYVYYKADWQPEEQFLYFQNLTSNEHFEFMEFNTTLSSIPDGTHTLQIVACGIVTIRDAMFVYNPKSDSNASIILTVNSVQPTPSPETALHPEPFPVVSVAAASVVAVSAGLLVHFKKRARKSSCLLRETQA